MTPFQGCGSNACVIAPTTGGMGGGTDCACAVTTLRRAVGAMRTEIERLCSEWPLRAAEMVIEARANWRTETDAAVEKAHANGARAMRATIRDQVSSMRAGDSGDNDAAYRAYDSVVRWIDGLILPLEQSPADPTATIVAEILALPVANIHGPLGDDPDDYLQTVNDIAEGHSETGPWQSADGDVERLQWCAAVALRGIEACAIGAAAPIGKDPGPNGKQCIHCRIALGSKHGPICSVRQTMDEDIVTAEWCVLPEWMVKK